MYPVKTDKPCYVALDSCNPSCEGRGSVEEPTKSIFEHPTQTGEASGWSLSVYRYQTMSHEITIAARVKDDLQRCEATAALHSFFGTNLLLTFDTYK